MPFVDLPLNSVDYYFPHFHCWTQGFVPLLLSNSSKCLLLFVRHNSAALIKHGRRLVTTNLAVKPLRSGPPATHTSVDLSTGIKTNRWLNFATSVRIMVHQIEHWKTSSFVWRGAKATCDNNWSANGSWIRNKLTCRLLILHHDMLQICRCNIIKSYFISTCITGLPQRYVVCASQFMTRAKLWLVRRTVFADETDFTKTSQHFYAVH